MVRAGLELGIPDFKSGALTTRPRCLHSVIICVSSIQNQDSKDLNRAIKRPHYPLPTVEEVATSRCKAKVFSVLDVKSGFWQVPLDEASSRLTTMNTPVGRYHWLRMAFGISSAPEEFQKRMNDTFGDLKGTAVITDDLLVHEEGDDMETAN